MQGPTETTSNLTDSGFASLLAALTAAKAKNPGDQGPQGAAFAAWPGGGGSLREASRSVPAWKDDDLADDIATLSYEQALRTHARYRPPADEDYEPVPQQKRAQKQKAPSRSRSARGAAAVEQNRKAASVTIRMSASECEQLHQRAAEAGLTVSAYLRSCVFEAEALRAQVKEALTQFRSLSAKDEQKTARPAGSSSPGWRERLFSYWAGRMGGHGRAVHA
jgi:predicted DNA binding CopG/RHH family protein